MKILSTAGEGGGGLSYDIGTKVSAKRGIIRGTSIDGIHKGEVLFSLL